MEIVPVTDLLGQFGVAGSGPDVEIATDVANCMWRTALHFMAASIPLHGMGVLSSNPPLLEPGSHVSWGYMGRDKGWLVGEAACPKNTSGGPVHGTRSCGGKGA